MKRLILTLPMILLAACASRPPKHIVLVPAPPLASPDGLRQMEQIREYRFGRYIDPTDRTVMHEAHPVFRIERAATWNLQPQGSPVRRPRAASSSIATARPNDAAIAEINQQKQVTKTVIIEAATLNQRLASLSEAIAQTKEMAAKQLLQQRNIAALQSRLNALEQKPVTPTASPAPSASDEPW